MERRSCETTPEHRASEAVYLIGEKLRTSAIRFVSRCDDFRSYLGNIGFLLLPLRRRRSTPRYEREGRHRMLRRDPGGRAMTDMLTGASAWSVGAMTVHAEPHWRFHLPLVVILPGGVKNTGVVPRTRIVCEDRGEAYASPAIQQAISQSSANAAARGPSHLHTQDDGTGGTAQHSRHYVLLCGIGVEVPLKDPASAVSPRSAIG